jgi:hypothetical protein
MGDLARLGRAELEAMAAAGEEALDCRRVLAKSGDSFLGEVLHGAAASGDWTHYPPGDVYDPVTHAQYFYHTHPPAERRPREEGHFHTFLRPRGMAPGTRPLVLPELAIADAPAAPADPATPPAPQPNQGADNDEPSHLIAIAMDGNGNPVRLFTTNRWVTGETWYAAADVMAMLDRFVIDLARPSWPLDRWLGALFRLFKPQMRALIQARDDAVMSWRRRHRGKVHVFEDRRLDVTSALDIDVEEQIRDIGLALSGSKGQAPGRPTFFLAPGS